MRIVRPDLSPKLRRLRNGAQPRPPVDATRVARRSGALPPRGGTSHRTPAILLGGGTVAIPVARSLGRAGVPVHALGANGDPVGRSRHCVSFVDLGAGDGVQDRWLDWLIRASPSEAVVLPCNDDALEFIARHRRTLVQRGYRPIEARDDVVLAMLDKDATYRLADEVGVAAPRTVLVDVGSGARPDLEGMRYPCAVKPRHSHLFQRHHGLAIKAFVAEDAHELAQHLDHMSGLGLDALVTEVVAGPDDAYHSYYTYVDSTGNPLFELTKHKLRQYPPGFGLATYHVIDHDEETIRVGRRFVQGVGLRGVACVEFKRDTRDGQLKLIECNHRFTAGTELVRFAGFDLPLLAYERALGRPGTLPHGYRTGVHMWHPVEDVRALRGYRRRGELSVGGWARSLLHRQHFPLFSWSDPVPSLRSNSRLPARIAHLAAGRIRSLLGASEA